jgi:hypothetical protein
VDPWDPQIVDEAAIGYIKHTTLDPPNLDPVLFEAESWSEYKESLVELNKMASLVCRAQKMIRCVSCTALWIGLVCDDNNNNVDTNYFLSLGDDRSSRTAVAQPVHVVVLVPYMGRPNSLRDLVRSLPTSVSEVRVTCYSGDQAGDDEVFSLPKITCVPVHGTFSRASAGNILLDTIKKDDNYYIFLDTDMRITPAFVAQLSLVVLPNTVYFPIVASQFSAEAVQLTRDFYHRKDLSAEYTARWRPYGYGNFAARGTTLATLRFDESIDVWGSEDTRFYKLAKAQKRISRMRDADIVHVWHPKAKCSGQSYLATTAEDWGSALAHALKVAR